MKNRKSIKQKTREATADAVREFTEALFTTMLKTYASGGDGRRTGMDPQMMLSLADARASALADGGSIEQHLCELAMICQLPEPVGATLTVTTEQVAKLRGFGLPTEETDQSIVRGSLHLLAGEPLKYQDSDGERAVFMSHLVFSSVQPGWLVTTAKDMPWSDVRNQVVFVPLSAVQVESTTPAEPAN